MTVKSREYLGGEDYQRIRELLIESYAITRRNHNWHIARLDAFRFGRYGYQEISGERAWEADFRLWETECGKLVGILHPEARSNIFFEVHPHYRYIEEEMLDWAEQHHSETRPQDTERWPLNTFVCEYDEERATLLARRGYRNLGPCGVDLSRSLDEPIPDVTLPEGYVIRALRREDDADVAHRTAVTNLVFNVNFTSESMRVRMGAPTPQGDLVVVAPDGTFASFCTIWFDEVNRVGAFEPVGTHPDYRRRGLAQAMMAEGLRRLKAWGATTAVVGTGYSSPANRLYESVGFTTTDTHYHWQKGF